MAVNASLTLLGPEALQRYVRVLQFASSISQLYSQNESAYLNYRLVEQAFIRVTDSIDLSRRDLSFDALSTSGIAVGIKTFLGRPESRKLEKVAEFTNQAARGTFAGLDHEEKASMVAILRNDRIASDARELGIDEHLAQYHCVVRSDEGGFVHEEAMPLIDIASIRPTSPGGRPTRKFPSSIDGHVYFADKHSQYKFDVSKNTLFKRFELAEGRNSDLFELPIAKDIWELLLRSDVDFEFFKGGAKEAETIKGEKALDSVVLPLYSTRPGSYGQVLPKSGINQWNAGGRARKFGEAYIPVPAEVRTKAPNFFPDRDTPFLLSLPNGKIVKAKICQAGGKALMADPNIDLLEWLFPILDGGQNKMGDRLRTRNPYTTSDLVRVDRDSVIVEKAQGPDADYTIRTASLGSYEAFISEDPV